MRFLLDQDVYEVTVRYLSELGHDVTRASELGLARAEDETLLKVAQERECIFVTRDRDYGALVFIRRILTGVIYLRMMPLTQAAVHQELAKVLAIYSEGKLRQSYIVIDASGHRIRDLST